MGPSTSASVPGATTKTPSGLLISLAILAMSFDEATPTEAVRPPVISVMSARMRPTTSSTSSATNDSFAARSTKASSSDNGSISSDSSRSRSMTSRLASRYASNRPPRNAACGQRARASAVRIADRTPWTRASYDAVATTPRWPVPPTMTGRPRSEGLSRCSTEAKKASRSRCMIDAVDRMEPL
jgi:hypothetical protein